MPKLPDTLGTLNQPTPQRSIQSYDAGIRGRANEQLGADIQTAGANIKEFTDRNAVLEAADKENKAQAEITDHLYNPENGILNKKGGDALGLTKATDEWLIGWHQRAMEAVTDPRTQRALNNQLSGIQNTVRQTIMRHESEQGTIFAGQITQGRTANANNAVALQYNDDKVFSGAMSQTQSSVIADGKRQSLPPEMVTENQRSAASNLWKTRIQSALNSGTPDAIVQAGKYYDQAMKSGQIDYADALSMGHDLKTVLPKANAQQAFLRDNQAASVTNLKASDIVPIMQHYESSGKQIGGAGSVAGPNDPTTSSAGAIGIMQVLPSTGKETAAKHGIAWDENKFNTDAEYNTKIGTAYMQDMVDKYGDTRLALAAYNAGPANVDKALAKSDPRKGGDFGSFIVALPQPTVTGSYIGKILGQATAIAPPQMDLATAQDKASKMGPDEGEYYLSMVNAHNQQITDAQKQQQNDVLAKIQPILEQTNGDLSAVPGPLLSAASKAGVLDKVRDYKGYTDEGFKSALDTMDTDTFSAFDFSDPAVRMRLSASDYDKFTKKQADMVNDPKNATMSRRVDAAVRYAFRSNDMVTPDSLMPSDTSADKDLKPELILKVARFKSLMQQQIQDEYSKTNKVPSAAEVYKMADSLIMDKARTPATFFGHNMPKWMDKVTSLSDLTVDMVPKDVKNLIELSRIKDGLPVTEDGVLDDYIRGLRKRGALEISDRTKELGNVR